MARAFQKASVGYAGFEDDPILGHLDNRVPRLVHRQPRRGHSTCPVDVPPTSYVLAVNFAYDSIAVVPEVCGCRPNITYPGRQSAKTGCRYRQPKTLPPRPDYMGSKTHPGLPPCCDRSDGNLGTQRQVLLAVLRRSVPRLQGGPSRRGGPRLGPPAHAF